MLLVSRIFLQTTITISFICITINPLQYCKSSLSTDKKRQRHKTSVIFQVSSVVAMTTMSKLGHTPVKKTNRITREKSYTKSLFVNLLSIAVRTLLKTKREGHICSGPRSCREYEPRTTRSVKKDRWPMADGR